MDESVAWPRKSCKQRAFTVFTVARSLGRPGRQGRPRAELAGPPSEPTADIASDPLLAESMSLCFFCVATPLPGPCAPFTPDIDRQNRTSNSALSLGLSDRRQRREAWRVAAR
jgi:hypothetical protein